MADQDRLAETLHPFPSAAEVAQGTMSADATSNQAPGDDGSQDAGQSGDGMTNDGDATTSAQDSSTVVCLNHRGDRYVWPYELCRSYEAIKPLLEEIYTVRQELYLVDEIKDGQYEIKTASGGIILPSLWANFVKPGSTIQLEFLANLEVIAERGLIRRREGTQDFDERINQPSPPPPPRRTVTYQTEVTQFPPPPPARPRIATYETDEWYKTNDEEDSEEEEEDDIDSESTSETESELAEPPKPPEPVREVVLPVDSEGNRISFGVDTAPHPRKSMPAVNGPTANGDVSRGPAKTEVLEPQPENLKITKATAAEAESRNVIQVHTLPGPENTNLRSSVKITWYHIPAQELDYNRFRNVCLAVPGLSERMQTLVRGMLKKLEEHKIKAFLGGLFIEPGTVLRADERGQSDPESVIFSCVPYLNLHPPTPRAARSDDDRLFPARTLMQSYYPYEPTMERDQEQAYKVFNEDRSGNIINVPNLWVMNIGADCVVTCGHTPLAQNLMKSIEVVPEDLDQLNQKSITTDTLTNIRLRDWDSRVLVFPLNSCRTYFQLEQNIREVRFLSGPGFRSRSLQVIHTTPKDVKKVEPEDWCNIVKRTDLIFIDLALEEKDEYGRKEERKEKSTKTAPSEALKCSTTSLVPPFFSWPAAFSTNPPLNEKGNPEGFTSTNTNNTTNCLENAEKVMLSQTLDSYQTVNEVDGTFTSTAFYEGLPEETCASLWTQLPSLEYHPKQTRGGGSIPSHHKQVVDLQCTHIGERTLRFFQTVHATFQLFVGNVDTSVLLRKVWGAMFCIFKMALAAEARGAVEYDPKEYSDPNWKSPSSARRGWYIRSDAANLNIPTPKVDTKFQRRISRCRRCQSSVPFESPDAAMSHLRKHLRSKTQQSMGDAPVAADAVASPAPAASSLQRAESAPIEPAAAPLERAESAPAAPPEPDLRDWIVNYDQAKTEITNAGMLVIIENACRGAEDLFWQAKELAGGVMNEDGRLSDLYRLPRQLVDGFRQIIIFYLAIERALYFTEQQYKKENMLEQMQNFSISFPFLSEGLDVLRRFSGGAEHSLSIARMELCRMVASPERIDIYHHLCLGPQYVCAWLMRRLLVKPLDDNMTAGDMYRAYLSTMSFQVNHRPSKRLLRAINFLQEELRILTQVNTWQVKLIQNYCQVLDDATYAKDIPFRRALFPFERLLLRSCLESLNNTREDYTELIRRCGPMSDGTKQALEITDEDHGKAIMVFTIVTVIFLPLSFVTSYLGMNTNDIRNMSSNQSLFWIIALPLTLLTMTACVLISYKGASVQDELASLYRQVSGKEDQSTSARGISVAQRKQAGILQNNPNSAIDRTALADQAEYASPQPDPGLEGFSRKATMATYVSETAKPVELTRPEPETQIQHPLPQSRLMETTAYTERINVPGAAVAAVQSAPTPVYIRINKAHVEEESLIYYNLPYETDPTDPNYFIVRQNLTQQEQGALFEHTERLRSRRDHRWERPPVSQRFQLPERRQHTAQIPTTEMYYDPPVTTRMNATYEEPSTRHNVGYSEHVTTQNVTYKEDYHGANTTAEEETPGYTWHKKSNRRRRRGGWSRRERGPDMEYDYIRSERPRDRRSRRWG